jgi:DNA-binding MurR/RpiR family transcriptional regulator
MRAQRSFGWIVGIAVLAAVISSDALSQQSLQQLESMNQFEQAMAAVDAIKQRKKIQCVMAIANGALCGCLSQKLPVNIYFRSYASIAKQEKEGLEYAQLSAADKKIVDQCVSDSP